MSILSPKTLGLSQLKQGCPGKLPLAGGEHGENLRRHREGALFKRARRAGFRGFEAYLTGSELYTVLGFSAFRVAGFGI